MTDPTTALHYTANGNFVNGVYAPGADGFNLADVGSVSELNALPPGVKGLVYLGLTNGADANFQATVSAFIGNPNLYGFYIADEPGPALAANLKAEADWIHANVPGAKTFMVEENMSSNTSPVYDYTPANTDIDLFGLDPYPVQTNVPNNLDYNIIPLAVSTAEADGVPQANIVPVYQAFGGGQYTTYILPTAAQEDEILSTWGSVIPDPAFDYAYSWGVQVGDTAISDDPALQTVFAAHNAGGTPPPPPPPPPAAPTITIAHASLTVAKHGGTVALGISETAPSGATDVTAKITGLSSYETIKDKLDGKTFSGSSITLSEAEVDSGLTLTSNYRGSGHPVATLTVTGSDLVGGVAATSAPQSIKVTDPGPSWSKDVANLLGGGAAGFNQPTESYDYLRVASATIAEPHRG
ncbi:MAG TPA: hypothetical protein VGG86_14930 [Roseiarcus sp.]|jgi:hypothetical protein